jgi:Rrf2 family protein
MFSETSTYALRALTYLVRSGGETRSIQARELASSASVPEAYLAKILSGLARAGVVKGTRGLGGGYRLTRRPGEIYLLEIVELIEGEQARPVCFFGQDRMCSDDDPCTAHESWEKVRRAYLDFLEQTSLADVAGAPGVGPNGLDVPKKPS